MAHKEGMRAASMRNIFFSERGKGPDKNVGRPRKISKVPEVVFDNSRNKDAEKIEKERTPEEKYFYLSSSLSRVLDLVKDETPYSEIKAMMRKPGKEGLDLLINAGVIDGSSVIHREKFRDLFKNTVAAMVLLIYKEYPGIKVEDASRKFPFTESLIGKERVKLVKAGFLEKKSPEGKDIIVLTKYSEELGIETWGLEEKLEKSRREKGKL